MARTKQTCRKPPVRKHKRLNAFIRAYDKLCKTDIKPRAQCIALNRTMALVKSSYEEMIRAYRYEVDKSKNRVIEDSDPDDQEELHQGESKNGRFKRNYDSDGDGDAGGAGTGAAAGGFFYNY